MEWSIIMLIITMGVLNVACFFIGAKVGQQVVKGEKIEIPNPIKSVRDDIQSFNERKETNKAQERLDAITHNIDVYDGTSIGQIDIPN